MHLPSSLLITFSNSDNDMLGERRLEQRLAEIEQIIERMELRRDNGFITDKMNTLISVPNSNKSLNG
jgi:hypothetical protein